MFDASVILLDNVVLELDLSEFGKAPEFTVLLPGFCRNGIRRVLVDRDGPRIDRMGLSQILAEEALSCTGISIKVDRLSGSIDSTIEIHPFTLYPKVCLVHPPGAVCLAQMRADALVQLGYISLNPAKKGRMVYLHVPIGKHALKIAGADRELQVPAYSPQNDLRRKLSTLERVLVLSPHYQLSQQQPLGRPVAAAARPLLEA